MGRVSRQWRRAKAVVRERIGPLRAPPSLWHSIEARRPLPPLAPPSELFGRNPSALRGRRELPDASGALAKGPQSALLHDADREWLVELARADDVPLPATLDREGYLSDDPLGYWLFGLGDALWLSEIAKGHGVLLGDGARVLDFGCSTGRVLRHFRALAPGSELRGIDVSSASVEWARANLPPPVMILHGTVVPGLPFPDAYFDLIYAGSVFTHIDEFEEAWLAELHRVLKPSGVAVLTFHPGRLWREMVTDQQHSLRRHLVDARMRMHPPGVGPLSDADFRGDLSGPRVVFCRADLPIQTVQVIHTHEWVRDRWGAIFDVTQLVEHAHGDLQDAMVGAAGPCAVR